jgi:hypothetical protein
LYRHQGSRYSHLGSEPQEPREGFRTHGHTSGYFLPCLLRHLPHPRRHGVQRRASMSRRGHGTLLGQIQMIATLLNPRFFLFTSPFYVPNTLSKDGNGPKVTKKHQYQRTCETTIKRQRPILGGVWRAWRKMKKICCEGRRNTKKEQLVMNQSKERGCSVWVRSTAECLICSSLFSFFFSPEQHLWSPKSSLVFSPSSPISVIFSVCCEDEGLDMFFCLLSETSIRT